jgi:DNA-binding PadR family transcriptional regulator
MSASRVAMHRPAVALGEHAVLALLAEQPRHGWAIVRALAPGGEIGRVWTLSRPLAYRAIDNLEAGRLVRATGTEPGDGPRRTILTATASGRREVDRWLGAPVEHLRDVRTELLLKLVFNARVGRDTRPLLRAQQRAFQPIFAALDTAANDPDADVVDRWRRENAEAVRRFLEHAPRVRSGSASRR